MYPIKNRVININNNSCNFLITVFLDSLKLSDMKRLIKQDVVVQKRKA